MLLLSKKFRLLRRVCESARAQAAAIVLGRIDDAAVGDLDERVDLCHLLACILGLLLASCKALLGGTAGV